MFFRDEVTIAVVNSLKAVAMDIGYLKVLQTFVVPYIHHALDKTPDKKSVGVRSGERGGHGMFWSRELPLPIHC